jgi:uncharacterized protein YukE
MSQIKADTDALRATIAAMRQGSSTIEITLQFVKGASTHERKISSVSVAGQTGSANPL